MRRSPWSVILIPWSLKRFCADCNRLLSSIKRMVFVGFVQYPKSGPLACRYSYHFFTPASDLTAELLSVYHTCFTSSFAVSLRNACISGRVDRAYIAIAALSPYVTQCVVPIFQIKHGGCVVAVVQVCVHGGHSLLMCSSLTFLLSLLKALSASTNSRYSLLSSGITFPYCMYCCFYAWFQSRTCLQWSTARLMASFSSPVIVLPMIRFRHSPTPTGVMLLVFFLSGTSLHARRADM